jgi:hypothetical protein
MRIALASAAFLLASTTIFAHGRTMITNAGLNFKLDVPDKLKSVAPPADVVAALVTADPNQGSPYFVVTITRLNGTIGQERLDPSKIHLPQGKVVRVRQQKWKSFDINVLECELEQEGVQMSVFAAQIPLRDEAIQLNVTGSADNQVEIAALLTELLRGLDGPSNRLTEFELGQRLGQVTPYFLVLLVGIIYVIWSRVQRRRSST